ncbi:MAG TPA: methyltransferase type 11 [Bacteroidales bacterium]|nr:methyltransferase type 11 [Bacteroidales bacterium]
MHYDPIKKTLGNLFFRHQTTHKLFYLLLDFMLLRTWHIHRALKSIANSQSHKKNLEILDAGCGLGQYSYYMAKKFPHWNITAVDIKEKEIAICQKFFTKAGIKNVKFMQRDLSSFVEPIQYDLILSVDVMEHIEDDQEVLSNLYQSLKPEGKLLINTPSNLGGSDVGQHNSESFIGEHVRDGYSIEDMTTKLALAGFENISTKYTYGFAGNLSWRLTMKYPMKALALSKGFLALLPFYYALALPAIVALNTADIYIRHKKGTGLQVLATK